MFEETPLPQASCDRDVPLLHTERGICDLSRPNPTRDSLARRKSMRTLHNPIGERPALIGLG